MIIVFGPKVVEDLRWFRDYHSGAAGKAIERYLRALDLLSSFPGLGRPLSDLDAREYVMPKTPFSLIYRVGPDNIEILRVWDQRTDRARLWMG
ncbi:hypothetical protein GCM10011390_46170 [Aureimonas endophytica]|uniref:Toxin ParE1/3/4 n=1 Tax=Aureimonas endophytica TaxID=2027858 RepID=A0A917EC76_9HYPH|nr:type II toxin-antitoxin system RelE/ParE family toxin [Aureimonas endophytica]GGE21589.1 hypothetical protein GCM10011390_46170 [Aureimonas endophytica]